MNLNNKVIIITGGVGGIGFVTTQYLLRNGAKYVAMFDLPDSDSEKVTKSLSILKQEFNEDTFGYYTCDVTNVEEFEASYVRVIELKNYVDILINNAGALIDNNVDLNIDLNYKAVVKSTLVAIEHMGIHKGKKGGVVVCIGSTAGLQNIPVSPVYNASKHAVVSFVRSMKGHDEVLGIRFVCICPDFTNTNLLNVDDLKKNLLDFIDSAGVPGFIAQQHLQKPDNVASAIVQIIEKGENGSIWVTADDQPPFGIRDINEKIELRFEL